MADAITSFFLLPQANRVSGSAVASLAPSALELGADNLTRNPRAETLGKLFTSPAAASNIAGLDSFLAVATAGQANSATPAKPPPVKGGKDGAKQPLDLTKNNNTAQAVFFRRETSAEARLKELLKSGSAPTPAASTNANSGNETAAAAAAITRNTGLRAEEGGEAVINSQRLNTNISGARPQDIIYNVSDGPRHGRLELASKPGEAVVTFTQQDLNLGRVKYINDGSESRGDSFDFTVGGGEEELSGSVNIRVSPVNDTPTVAINAGLALNEGATATINPAQLSATDPDNIDAETSFTVTQGPAHGRLEFADNAGTAITSFTQADIASGRVRYVNDGSENTSDSFNFTASDGSATSTQESFAITITPVDDAPVQAVNTGATAAEGGTTAITSSQLNTTDADTARANITYGVTSGPAHGRLEFSDNPGVFVTSFTQADLDSGRVRYVHDGSETTSDSFTFTTSDATTSLAPANFNINVTAVNDAPVVATNTGITVNRGSSGIINSTKLNSTDADSPASSLVYNVTRAPTRGRLELTSNPGQSITSFTQADLDAGRVRYVHTNFLSGQDDTFRFRVSDGTAQTSNSTFRVTVN